MLFWKTRPWIKYILSATWGDNEDLSFDLLDNDNDLTARILLIREGSSLTFQGGPCPEPYVFTDKKYIVDAINNIAVKNNIERVHIKTDIPGYINHTGYTCILDPMYQYIPRKGCKAAITKGKKHLTVDTSNDVSTFMSDYFKIAGKQTRPEKSFEILQDFCDIGYAILFRAKYDKEVAGYAMIIYYSLQAYYFMAGNFDKFREYNVGHVLQDAIINYLAKMNIRHYELGEQVYDSLYACYDDKEKNISKFKRGFGGRIVPYSHSEYFWNKQLEKDTLQKRLDDYIAQCVYRFS